MKILICLWVRNNENLFVDGEDQWGIGQDLSESSDHWNAEVVYVSGSGPDSVEIQGKKDDITVVHSNPPPEPLTDALGALAGKIQTSDGGVHPKILEMQELLEKGAQPVVVLKELAKFYDSPSVKYNQDNKQAVREAAKDIYDKTIHPQRIEYHDQLGVVDALVGMDFDNIDAMRLSAEKNPIKL